jgi:RNA polymerase sigma factor (sigma-70 family)
MSQGTPPPLPPARLHELADEELLERSATDPFAFGVFYDRHSDAVLSYLRRRTGDTEEALDLTSDVFISALDSRKSYDPEEGPARGWLFGIVNNIVRSERKRRAIERLKWRRFRMPGFEFSDQAIEDAEAVIDASEAGLLKGLERLSPAERDAVKARIIDERDYADIARDQNSTEAAIRQRVSRGLNKLGRMMKGGEA